LLKCKKGRIVFIYLSSPAIVLENKPKRKEENVMKAEKGYPNNQELSLSKYEPPVMITYSEEELLEDIETMSVQACQSFNAGKGVI
jgi:hypothetical protein